MSLSDRYSCQEHGKKIEQGCVACEVYKDIYELEAERDTWHKMWEEQGIINDRNSKHWQSQYNDLIAERDKAVHDYVELNERYVKMEERLTAERDRLKEHIKLLEEDIKSYQADL